MLSMVHLTKKNKIAFNVYITLLPGTRQQVTRVKYNYGLYIIVSSWLEPPARNTGKKILSGYSNVNNSPHL